jgi:hypothetical protein
MKNRTSEYRAKRKQWIINWLGLAYTAWQMYGKGKFPLKDKIRTILPYYNQYIAE